MPIVPLNSNVATAPGVYVSDYAAGIIPAELATFNRAYLLGSGGVGAIATPTQVISLEDAQNQFQVAGVTAASIRLFFRNHPYGVLQFVRVPIGRVFTLMIAVDGTDAALTSYTVSLGAASVTYTPASGASLATATQELADEIADETNNTSQVLIPQNIDTTAGTLEVRVLDASDGASAFSASATGGTGTLASTEINDGNASPDPRAADYVWAIGEAFDPDEHPPGFVLCPEAFADLSAQEDRTAVATALENHAASEGYDWVALVDSGPSAQIPSHQAAHIEGKLYTSARGHLAYFFPHLVSLEDEIVPPSAAVAAIGLRRYQDQGFVQPPAGSQYPVRGVKDPEIRVTRQHQTVGNPDGINAVRRLPNQGVVIYGSRTRSDSPYYRFVNTRVILSVLINTYRRAFNTLVFSAIDGQGVLFSRILETANTICYRLWRGGAFFGASPQAAFYNQCDRNNNPDLDLEAGIVRLDSYVVPSPTMERLLISVGRTAIGSIDIVVASLNNNGNLNP
jgi:phage tail sheath protein FI